VELATPLFVVQEAPEGISLQEVDIVQGHDKNHTMRHLVQSNLSDLLLHAVNSYTLMTLWTTYPDLLFTLSADQNKEERRQ
jgi:hypothetical protein